MLLLPLSTILEKLTVAQRAKNLPPFMELEGSSPCLRKSTTGYERNDNMLGLKVVTEMNQEDIREHSLHTGLKQRQGKGRCVLHTNSISSLMFEYY